MKKHYLVVDAEGKYYTGENPNYWDSIKKEAMLFGSEGEILRQFKWAGEPGKRQLNEAKLPLTIVTILTLF